MFDFVSSKAQPARTQISASESLQHRLLIMTEEGTNEIQSTVQTKGEGLALFCELVGRKKKMMRMILRTCTQMMKTSIAPDEVEVFWMYHDSTFEKAETLQVIDSDTCKRFEWSDGYGERVVRNVSAKRLSSIYSLEPELAVLNDQKWLGYVVDVFVNVEVSFPNGDVVLVKDAQTSFLIPEESQYYDEPDEEMEEDDEDEESEQIYYYVGQRVRPKVSALARVGWEWVTKTDHPPDYSVGVVSKVTLVRADVDWVITMKGDPEAELEPIVEPGELTPLNRFVYTRWEIGEQAFFEDRETVSEADVDADLPTSNHGPGPGKMPAMIEKIRTYVDVQWQDSTISRFIPSVEVVPGDNFLDEDFWPEDAVVRRQPADPAILDIGVVQRVNSRERTAVVNWIGVEDSPGILEELPVMDLKVYEPWEHRLGDVVLAMPKEGEEHLVAGEIVDIKQGRIRVSWTDGTESLKLAEELYLVNEDEGLQNEDDDIFECEYYTEDDQSEEELDDMEEDEDEGVFVEGNNVVEPAFLGQGTTAWWQESEMDSNNYQLFSAMDLPVAARSDEEPSTVGTPPNESTEGIAEAVAESAIERDHSDTFTVLDHATDSPFSMEESPQGSHFVSRIMKEWELLKSNLTEGIYVRVFEDRIDLMQVMIIGPQGTPYADIPFFFDVQFPSDYPNSPPKVRFRAFGEKVNPNLYVDGTVCLSLLGTWSGRGIENWSPDTSNVLQVVLSIQGLILGTNEPYYLEAG
ncbi:hypothetical protein PROFUN_15709, partial [Planoprotostelium fungivorum]